MLKGDNIVIPVHMIPWQDRSLQQYGRLMKLQRVFICWIKAKDMNSASAREIH